MQFLSEDQKLVYLRRRDGRIDAVDKMTGKVQFTSKTSFDVFAINLKDSTIFAAMRDGRIFAIKPVVSEGEVGKMVLDWRQQPIAAAR